MYAQTHNTVRAFRNRPLLMSRDISGNNMGDFYQQLLGYFQTHLSTQKSIGDTAVQFYMLNHGIALIDTTAGLDAPLSPAQCDLYQTYHKHVGEIGVRMVYDIVFMLTAMCATTHPDAYHLDVIESSYGVKTKEFIQSLCGSGDKLSFWTPDFNKLKPIIEKARAESSGVKIGDAIRSLGYILDVRQRELAYGPLWRDIARMASSFFEGHKSCETTIDTAFTFCHCNGSFFEKGKLFTAVGNELFKALDVQRSGQIPQFVAEKKSQLTTNGTTQKMHSQFAKEFPEVFNGSVKWSEVKEVTRNQLVFTQKYKQHWNATIGGGAAAAHNHPPPPKIFAPIDEDGYLNMTKGF